MGPLARRLASWGSSGKAVGEVMCSEASPNSPVGSDCSKRLENEGAVLEPMMGNGQQRAPESAAAPKNDIEVKHARSPTSSPSTPEFPLDRLDSAQHLRRLQIAFHQGDTISEIASGTPDGSVENDWRGVK
jgi:hypothetical protein